GGVWRDGTAVCNWWEIGDVIGVLREDVRFCVREGMLSCPAPGWFVFPAINGVAQTRCGLDGRTIASLNGSIKLLLASLSAIINGHHSSL
ncbi:hypothetical protein, partial [Herbaspirillum sp. BH-1]|uniref:hypothetical protein n=1 Tax=Herbaspirillum sp. (strain BH-1) TaxID=2058884 RepID=UPI001E6536E5